MKINSSKKHVISSRLAHLRAQKGMTQTEFASNLAEIYESTHPDSNVHPINISLVSAWERGLKNTPSKYISSIIKLYGCTEEYLYGESDDPHSTKKTEFTGCKPLMEPIKDLSIYDTKPIFIVFNNFQHNDQWGLCDMEKKRIVCTDFHIPITSTILKNITAYPAQPYQTTKRNMGEVKPLDIISFLKKDKVYVVMNTHDKQVHMIYDGWYRHNEDKTALINSIGHVLPYDGLNISYLAYADIYNFF